ncbi:MAG TPA: CoA pyrophosphatase [Psychromonas hadalis]|nr:CoA pyrophosphatase [Psychromonas hadalis]
MNKQRFLSRFSLRKPSYLNSAFTAKIKGFLKKAAVLVPIVERNNQLFILLTVRAEHLKHHPGQISFPGGGIEESDHDLSQTALRETHEETGVSADKIHLFGELASIETGSGYRVSPYLGFVDENYQLTLDHNEVQAAFEIPLNFLLNKQHYYPVRFLRNSEEQTTYCIPYQTHLIWGMTAQILSTLIGIVED